MTFKREILTRPEVVKMICEMRNSEVAWTEIQRKLKEQYSVEATPKTLLKIYNMGVTRMAEIISGDDSLKTTLKSVVIDAAKNLQEINKCMMDILHEAKTRPEIKVSAANQVLQQLYYQEKALARIEKGFNLGNVSRIEYTKISVGNLDELEKSGYIKIIRKPGGLVDMERATQIRNEIDAKIDQVEEQTEDQAAEAVSDMMKKEAEENEKN